MYQDRFVLYGMTGSWGVSTLPALACSAPLVCIAMYHIINYATAICMSHIEHNAKIIGAR